MQTLQQRLASLIKEARLHKGLTQVQLAEKAGITQANLSRIEAGKQNISAQQIETLLAAIGVQLIIDWKEF